MKYNPKINESVARFNGFAHLHPLQDESSVQGALELMYDFKSIWLKLLVWMPSRCNLLRGHMVSGPD